MKKKPNKPKAKKPVAKKKVAPKKKAPTVTTATARAIPAEVVVVAAVPFTFEPTEWRKRRGSDAWHFVPTCSNWPTEDFRARVEKPTTGESCDECLSKANLKGGG